MANDIANGFKSFWHAMTSNDRHANHDSPYRALSSNTHQPLGVGRNPPLQSVGSSGHEGSGQLYREDASRSTTALAVDTSVYSPRSPGPNGHLTSPTTPYSPGMRSASAVDGPAGGGIALQDFADGQPPAPPIHHTWERIEHWADENYYEVLDQLCTPATVNDINELEYQLDCSLPMEVRDSLQIHDGQERGGMPTGIIFGCMLMDCEEVLDEWKNWRIVDKDYLNQVVVKPVKPIVEAGPSSRPTDAEGFQSRQDCQPDGTIQKVYSHPGWIPLARDWGGNYLAVDLAPGPKGTWGQIIIFGRDYDTKYVVGKSWAHFLAMVADDMQSSHWYVDEENAELKLKDPRAPRAEPSYMEILRVRNERKYGRRRFSRGPPGSRPGSKPNSQPSSPHLSGTPNGRGLTRPPKDDSDVDANHLKIPTKKQAKQMLKRTESAEPEKPQPTHNKSENDAKDSVTLLDEPATPITISDDKLASALTEVSLDDEPKPLQRTESDLISSPPPVAKRSSVIIEG